MVGLVGRTLCERLFTYPFIHQSINPAFGLVVPAGNAPASSGYQPGALLLSYRTKSSREALSSEHLPAAFMFQSKNATLAIVRLWVSVFMTTRCQNGSVMVSWSA